MLVSGDSSIILDVIGNRCGSNGAKGTTFANAQPTMSDMDSAVDGITALSSFCCGGGGGIGSPTRFEYSYGNHLFHDSFTIARVRNGRIISSVAAEVARILFIVTSDDSESSELSLISSS